MNHRKSAMGRSRDFGTEGAGKGDADRVSDAAAFDENFSKIEWPVVSVGGFRKVGTKQVKTYGAARVEEPSFVLFTTSSGIPPNPELEDYIIWDR